MKTVTEKLNELMILTEEKKDEGQFLKSKINITTKCFSNEIMLSKIF